MICTIYKIAIVSYRIGNIYKNLNKYLVSLLY